jgi:hemerythrin-like domain-containing protein
MRPTEELVAEHDAVLVALRILHKLQDHVSVGAENASTHLEQLLEFFSGFLDCCHHSKEEDVLFPEIERYGSPGQSASLSALLADHQAGRARVGAMNDGLERLRRGDTQAVAAIREHGRGFRDLLTMHIAEENDQVFPIADQIIPPEAASDMAERFATVERERVGPGRHEAYHHMLQDLAGFYHIG